MEPLLSNWIGSLLTRLSQKAQPLQTGHTTRSVNGIAGSTADGKVSYNPTADGRENPTEYSDNTGIAGLPLFLSSCKPCYSLPFKRKVFLREIPEISNID
jgi:hypothetical protein